METLLFLGLVVLAVLVYVLWGRIGDLDREIVRVRDGVRRIAERLPRTEPVDEGPAATLLGDAGDPPRRPIDEPAQPAAPVGHAPAAAPDAFDNFLHEADRRSPRDLEPQPKSPDERRALLDLAGVALDANERKPKPADERRAAAVPVRAEGRMQDRAAGHTLEELLGGKWLTWVGAVAVVLGAGFFFKYAIDEGWIGPTARVLIGLAVGIVAFAGGVIAVRRDYGWLAQGLVGAAAGVLYFDLWAAHHLYALIDLPAAFAAMTLVTVATLAFATAFATQPTAVLGLVGGFLVPLVLNDGVDRPLAFFSYLMLLDVGVLAIALFHRWRPLRHTAFAGTLLLWALWFAQHYEPSKLASTIPLMTGFFILFVAIGVWASLLQRGRSEPDDAFLLVATPIVYFAPLYAITLRDHSDWHGTIALLLSLFYAGLASLQWWRNRADRQALVLLAGIGITFLVLAVPLELTDHWIPIAWALLAGVLVEAGLHAREPRLRQAGFGLLLVVGLILVGYALRTFEDPAFVNTVILRLPAEAATVEPPASTERPTWIDLFNARSLSFLVTTAILGLLAWEYHRRDDVAEIAYDWERRDVAGGLLAGVPLLLLATAIVETFAFGRRAGWYDLTLVSAFSMWTTLAGLGLVALAVRPGPPWLRHFGTAVFVLSTLFLAFDSLATFAAWSTQWAEMQAEGPGSWGLFLVNPRGLAFLFAIAGAAAAAWLARMPEEADGPALTTTETLGFLAYLAGLVMLTTEIHAQGVIRDWGTASSLAITGTWTLYAIGTLLAGIHVRSPNIRALALALFVLTTGKVFLHDVWYLHRAIRTLAFTGLGVSLLLVSWLYRRHRDRIRSWLTG